MQTRLTPPIVSVIVRKYVKCVCKSWFRITYFSGDEGYSITCSKCGKLHEIQDIGRMKSYRSLDE